MKSRLDLPFDLTWISIWIIYSSRTIYPQIWSFWGKAFFSYQLHKVWAINITFYLDLWPTDLKINSDHQLILDCLLPRLKHVGQSIIKLSVAQRIGDQHELWPWHLTYWLYYIMGSSRTIYLPILKLLGQSVLELSVAHCQGRPTYRPTDGRTDKQTGMYNAICSPFSQGGISINVYDVFSLQLQTIVCFNRAYVKMAPPAISCRIRVTTAHAWTGTLDSIVQV